MNVGIHLLLFNSMNRTCQPSYSKKKGKREVGAFFFRGIRNGSVKTWVSLFVSFLQAAAILNSTARLTFETNNTKYSLNCSELWTLFMTHVRKTPSNSELHNFFLLHSSPIFSHYHVSKTTNESSRYNQAQLYNKCKVSKGYAFWPSFLTLRCWQTLG